MHIYRLTDNAHLVATATVSIIVFPFPFQLPRPSLAPRVKNMLLIPGDGLRLMKSTIISRLSITNSFNAAIEYTRYTPKISSVLLHFNSAIACSTPRISFHFSFAFRVEGTSYWLRDVICQHAIPAPSTTADFASPMPSGAQPRYLVRGLSASRLGHILLTVSIRRDIP
jgi:hypothetical protein